MKNKLVLLVSLVILCGGLILAQEQTGELRGIVKEEGGEPLPGVAVKAVSTALIREVTALTDQNGRYRLLQLPPGKYSLTFSLSGFTTITREEIVVSLGKTLSLDIVMTPATLEAESVVIGQAPVVDVTKSATTYEIAKDMFDKLPKGRDFESIVYIASGVNEETAQLNGTSFSGASSSENMYFFDGMDTTDVQSGYSGQGIVFENVEEVQVKDSGYAAEYGGSMGGVINVITRSGGNEYHGEGIFYLESSSLTGEERPSLWLNPYDPAEAGYVTYPKDSHSVYEVGFNLGGYLIKDRLWFYGSYIPRSETTTRIGVFIDEPTSNKEFTQYQRADRVLFKLTFTPLSKLRMNLSYINDYSRYRGSLPTQDGLSDPNYNYGKDGQNYPIWSASFNADYMPKDNLLISVRAGRYYQNTYSIVEPPPYPRYYFLYSNIDIPGVPEDMVHGEDWHSYPYDAGWDYRKAVEARWSAAMDVSYFIDLAGEHALKAGFGWNRGERNSWEALAHDYNYFAWGMDYSSPNLGDVPTEYGYFYAVDPAGDIYNPRSDRFTLFIQDSWTIANRLTLNFGVRLESENYPSFVDPTSDLAKEHPEYLNDFINFDFADKIAPRLGFAYDIFGDRRLKVFGSWGLYYDVMKLHMSAATGGATWVEHYYRIPEWAVQNFQLPEYNHQMNNPPADLAPYFLESLNQYIPSFDMFQPDMKPYGKMEYSFGLQAKVSEDISFSARYLHNHIFWAIEDIGVQDPEGSSYYIGNPGSDWINAKYAESEVIPDGVKCPKAIRKYDSLDIGLDKRFSKSWMAGFHYTLSRLWGNMSGLASSDEHGRQDPNTLRYFDGWWLPYAENYPQESTGVLNTDRPYQFKLYGAYSFGFGLTVGTSIFAASGTPESTELYINDTGGYYPVGRGDMGRTPFLWRVDAYAEYQIKIAQKYAVLLSANIYNVTNNRIAQRIYNSYNSEGYWLTNEQLVAGFDYLQVVQEQNLLLDSRYGKEFFFQSPLAVRLGVKFIF
jgi:hypothetical protein